jgi:hypothetical protein
MKKFIALAILLIIPVAVCSQSIGGYYGPAVSPYLVYDTFTGSDGTSLADHTPEVGGPWTVVDGNWTIRSNKLHLTPNIDYVKVVIDSGVANSKSQIYVPSSASTGYQGLITRYQDANNYWYFRFLNGAFSLRSVQGGEFTERSSASTCGTMPQTFEFTASGTTKTAILSGGCTAQATTDLFGSATKVGIISLTHDTFDTFIVTRD